MKRLSKHLWLIDSAHAENRQRPPLTLWCSRLQRANMACLQRRDGAPDSRRRPVAVLSTSSCASPSVQLTLTHVALPACCQQSAPLSPAVEGVETKRIVTRQHETVKAAWSHWSRLFDFKRHFFLFQTNIFFYEKMVVSLQDFQQTWVHLSTPEVNIPQSLWQPCENYNPTQVSSCLESHGTELKTWGNTEIFRFLVNSGAS